MDKGEETLPFYLNGQFFGSGYPGGGLQLPPGFNSNMRLAPSLDSSFRLDHHPPPPCSFRHGNLDGDGARYDGGGVAAIRPIPDSRSGNECILKKKRGRPRKSLTLAVGTVTVPTALTPQKKRGLEIPSPGVSEHPDLSKLKPPSRSVGFRTGAEFVNLLKTASSVLISGIKEAKDAKQMIDLSSKAFVYFDSVQIDYTPVYKAVCSVIHRHCEQEALAKLKPHSAFITKALHDQAVVESSQAAERCARINKDLEDAQRDFDAVTAHLNRLMEEIKNASEKKAKLEAQVVAARADKVDCDEAYTKARSKVENISPKMSEAQKAIDEFERRWIETMDGLNRAMEDFSSVRI